MPGEMEDAGQAPEAPARPKIAPGTLEQYFESIEDPFRETQAGLAKNSPIGCFVAILVFSLIPAIPYLMTRFVRHFVGPRVFWLRSFHLHVASFWFWWVVCFVISLSMLILVTKFSGASAEEKKGWLSPAQIRFAYCYSVIKEIKSYKTNHLSRHIDAAVEYLDKTAKSLLPVSTLETAEGFYPDQYWRKEIQLTESQAAIVPVIVGSRPKWYRLRPETETILQACREFMPKVRDRLKDRKDLNAIEAVLGDLAAYQYTEIPELSDAQSEARFEEGTQLLLSFAQQVMALQPYRSEPTNPTPKEKLSRKLFLAGQKLSIPFTHANVLVTFCSWLVLMLFLFWGGFYLALKFYPIKMDSTIMATLIRRPHCHSSHGGHNSSAWKGEEAAGVGGSGSNGCQKSPGRSSGL